MAETLLGSGAEVAALGDLAHNGQEQALVVNRLAVGLGGGVSGVPFTRAAVLQRDGARWTEVLRCDEYLKNPMGFLDRAAKAPVTGWSVVINADRPSGPGLYFTPLATPSSPGMRTIAVRWNPRAKRYQAVDGISEHFLDEAASLEPAPAELR